MNSILNIKTKSLALIAGVLLYSSVQAQSHKTPDSQELTFTTNSTVVKTKSDSLGLTSKGDYFYVSESGSYVKTKQYNKDSLTVKEAEELGLMDYYDLKNKKENNESQNSVEGTSKNYTLDISDKVNSSKNSSSSSLEKGLFSLGLTSTSYVDELANKQKGVNFMIGYNVPLISTSSSALKAYVGVQTNAPKMIKVQASPYELSSTDIINQTTFETKNETYSSTTTETVSKTFVDLGFNFYKKVSFSSLYFGGGVGLGEITSSGTSNSYVRNSIISSSGSEVFLGQKQLDSDDVKKETSLGITSYFVDAGMIFSKNWGLGAYLGFSNNEVSQVGVQVSFSF